jgi:hypothetical protein
MTESLPDKFTMDDALDAYVVLQCCSSPQLRSWIMRKIRTSGERLPRNLDWLIKRGLLVKVNEERKRRILSYFIATELGKNYIPESDAGFRRFLEKYREHISKYSESKINDLLNYLHTM